MTNQAPEAAFANPATVRAWRRERRRYLRKLAFWALCILGYAELFTIQVDSMSEFAVFYINAPVFIAITFGISCLSLRWQHLGRMRAILTTYPWQDCAPLGTAHPAGIEYFRLPDPDEPHKNIQVAFRYNSGKRWRRAIKEARSAGFAFAGDPRFACVITVSGCRELLSVQPQHLHLNDDGTRPRSVSEACWQRAQGAGITTPPSREERRRKLLSSLWKGLRSRPAR